MRPDRNPKRVFLPLLIALIPGRHVSADDVLIKGLALDLELKPPAMGSNLQGSL
jgi:hypothetical protein